MISFNHRFTVFTPTYNRAHTLETLYRSLQKQNFTDFEWLIIDDGSSDGTNVLIQKWASEKNLFPIHYFLKENGGKHTAINYGLNKAQGELFFTVDSDDFLTSDALQKIDIWVKILPDHEQFAGVVGNLGLTLSKTPNAIFENEWRDACLLERYPEYSKSPIDGERAFVFFTEVHKKYRFPEFSNEKFMTEAVTWNRMAHDGYKMRFYNDIICIYKFLPDGLTRSGNKIFYDNPKGYGLWMREKAQFCRHSFFKRLKMYYGYFFTQKNKLSLNEISTNIGASYLLIALLSFMYLYKKWYRRTVKSLGDTRG